MTDVGLAQAEQAGKDVQENGVSFDYVFVSPLKRAQQTANIVVETIGYTGATITDERLTEYDMGLRSGTSNVETVSGFELTSGEGAEDPEGFKKRVSDFMDYVVSLDGNVLVVGHSFVYRMIQIIKDDGDPRMFSELAAPKNGMLLKFDVKGWGVH